MGRARTQLCQFITTGKGETCVFRNLSLADLMANNDVGPEGQLVVILKSHFDGGNQADSTQYDVVTLAVVSGTKEQWIPFEIEWKKDLKKHKAKYLHTTDAVAMNDPFDNDSGWTEKSRDAFLLDCVTVASRHIAHQKTNRSGSMVGLYPATITIVLKDFNEARDLDKRLPRTPYEICTTQALYRALEWGNEIMGAEYYHLFFDQNESFRGHICDRQQNKKARRHLKLMPRVVRRQSSLSQVG
jgi:hypothetical protein